MYFPSNHVYRVLPFQDVKFSDEKLVKNQSVSTICNSQRNADVCGGKKKKQSVAKLILWVSPGMQGSPWMESVVAK